MTAEDWQHEWNLFPLKNSALHETGLVVTFNLDRNGKWTAVPRNTSEWSYGDPERRDKLDTLLSQAAVVFEISTKNSRLSSSEE